MKAFSPRGAETLGLRTGDFPELKHMTADMIPRSIWLEGARTHAAEYGNRSPYVTISITTTAFSTRGVRLNLGGQRVKAETGGALDPRRPLK